MPTPFHTYTDEDGEWEPSDAGGVILKCLFAIVIVVALVCVCWPK